MIFGDVTRSNGEFTCHSKDNKFYKTVNLVNNLQVVLISSNSKDDKDASIALSIKTGSFDDPDEYAGLAHLMSNLIIREIKFLEHIKEEEIIDEEEEDDDDEVIDEKDSNNLLIGSLSKGIKRTRNSNLNQTKKVIKRTRKLVKQKLKERSTSGLIYLLNQVNGSIKLSTEFEYTTFQLDLPTDNLESILDDFYLRFKDQPAFTDYLIRETIKIIKHDYFQNIKSNSMMKLKILLSYLVDDKKLNYPSNPFFDIENESNIYELKEKLLEFFLNHYQSPNKMKLILKSNLKLSEMEDLLNKTFANLILRNQQDQQQLNPIVKKHKSNDVDQIRGIHSLFAKNDSQFIYYIKPHNKKPNIEDYLPIRQNLVVNLDKFEDYNLNQQFDDKLVDENGLGRTISNKITFDNNHLISSYTSNRELYQFKDDDEQQSNQFCFIFHVPYDPSYYPIMPTHFIGSLIRKEGPGTLISYLRKHDLVTKIQADNLSDCNFSNNSIWNLFYIKFHLTKKGLSRLDEIIKCLASFLQMLFKLKEFNLDKKFEEYSKLMLFDYHFKEIRSNSSNDLFVTVKKMHSYKLNDILIANRIPTQSKLGINVKIVKNLLKYLKLEDSILCVLSDNKNFDSIQLQSITSKGIDIKRMEINRQLFDTIELFEIENYPTTNPFLKNNQKINVERPIFQVPQLIKKNDNAKLMYKKEYSELLPLTSVNLLISIDKFKMNAKLATILDLILAISEIEMEELFFQIREAGFLYRVEFNRFGLNISSTGNDEINKVFKKIINNFKAELTESKLERAKQSTLINYQNEMKNKFHVYLDLQNSILFKNHFTIQQRLNELNSIKLNDLYKLMNLLFNASNRIYLIQGNYTVEDAKKFFRQIESLFQYKIDTNIDYLLEYDDLLKDNESIETVIDNNEINIDEIIKTKKQHASNQTYNIEPDQKVIYNEIEDVNERVSEELLDQTNNNDQQKQILIDDDLSIIFRNLNELIPKSKIHEFYCFANLKNDSLDPIFTIDNTETINIQNNGHFQSFNHTPNQIKSINGDKRFNVVSTALKNEPNRKLLFDSDSSKYSCSNSKISNSPTISKTKSNSFANNTCIDTTNHNYNLSPLNRTDKNYSNIINQNSQIVSNLYFTNYYQNDTDHTILLKLLVELIKIHMNAFFTNENNIREKYFNVDNKEYDKNTNTPEITFQDQIIIDGQIECVEFELAKSKGFVFIVFDNYSLLDTKTIDRLIELFLRSFIFDIIMDLSQNDFNQLTEKVLANLNKKVTWSQNLNNNWNEILICKQRFQLKEQQKTLLSEFDRNFFRRWAYATVKKLNEYSKLGIHLLKDEDDRSLEANFCTEKKLEFLEPELIELNKLGSSIQWINKMVIHNLDKHKMINNI